MHKAHRTFLVAQVWLTALLTLGSGVPQVMCVCPNGRTKPFCMSIFPGLQGCCCSDGVPASRPTRECCCEGHAASRSDSAEKPCCRAKYGGDAESRPTHSQIAGRCCRKTLTPPNVVTVLSLTEKQLPAGDLPAVSFEITVVSCAATTFVASDARSAQHQPPIDLTIALQRLVI